MLKTHFKLYFFIFLMVFSLTSCARHKHAKIPPKVLEPVMKGAVLDATQLSEGGNLAIVPFKAGTQAEATDELDNISQMVIKGISDRLSEKNTALRIIDDNKDRPKFVLQGYVQEYTKPSRMSRVTMRSKKYLLSLEGEIWLAQTGQRLLTFSIKKQFNPKKESALDVSYALGLEIGDFVDTHSK